MTKLESLLLELENEQLQYVKIAKLPLLVHEINEILARIAHCKEVSETDSFFDLLAQVHDFLAKTIFVEKFEVPDSLFDFFKIFDRVDNREERIRLYHKIRDENYCLPLIRPNISRIVFAYNPKIALYELKNISDVNILQLAHLLISHFSSASISRLKNFLNNQSENFVASNLSYIRKEGPNLIIGREKEINNPHEATFETTNVELQHILDQWRDAQENNPKIIIITHKDSSLSINFEEAPGN